MKNIKPSVLIIIALSIGITIGYFLFGNNNQNNNQTVHSTEDKSHQEKSDIEQIWTCSMHPQIRQNEPGLCPICEMDLIPLETNSSNDPLVLQMTEAAVSLANIQTSIVASSEKNNEGEAIRLSGKVQADERLASSQVSHVPGRIEKLYVSFTGEEVKTGQKLAEIYAPELITAQQELLEAIKLKELNPKLLDAARNKLIYWKIPKTTITKIEEDQKIQEVFPVYASKSGIVTNRRVSVGDYLSQGEPLFDLMNLKKVWVLFDAYEKDLTSIKIGSKIQFSSSAFPDKVYNSKISYIDPVINQKTRTASVRTELNNYSGDLKPEMFVTGTIINKLSSRSKELLSIPKSAVMWTGARSVVYVKQANMEIPSFQFREIKLGERIGNNYQVLEGLEPGEELVTNGNFTIDAAAQLNNQASMMNRDVLIKKENTNINPDYSESTDPEFKKQLNAFALEYIKLKNALVATDYNLATQTAAEMMVKLDNIEMKLLKGDAHNFWMEQKNILMSHGTMISEIEDIDEQRIQFKFLSDALINSIEAFGSTDETIYVQHCPMALNNKGADWISLEKEIKNPYFGSKMMKCGLVKRTFND